MEILVLVDMTFLMIEVCHFLRNTLFWPVRLGAVPPALSETQCGSNPSGGDPKLKLVVGRSLSLKHIKPAYGKDKKKKTPLGLLSHSQYLRWPYWPLERESLEPRSRSPFCLLS